MPTSIHVVANQKGGVGKTTIAVNLAAVVQAAIDKTQGRLARRDSAPKTSPVVVANADPQGSSVWWSSRVENHGTLPFDYVQITGPEDLARLRDGRYQHVFVDTPGSMENEQILQAVLDEADDVIVPLTTEPLTFDPTTRTIQEVLEPRGIPYTVVLNAWDPRDGEADLRETAEFIAAQGWPVANNVVRRYKVHAKASLNGVVCTQYPKSRIGQEAMQDFLVLALELGYGGKVDG